MIMQFHYHISHSIQETVMKSEIEMQLLDSSA